MHESNLLLSIVEARSQAHSSDSCHGPVQQNNSQEKRRRKKTCSMLNHISLLGKSDSKTGLHILCATCPVASRDFGLCLQLQPDNRWFKASNHSLSHTPYSHLGWWQLSSVVTGFSNATFPSPPNEWPRTPIIAYGTISTLFLPPLFFQTEPVDWSKAQSVSVLLVCRQTGLWRALSNYTMLPPQSVHLALCDPSPAGYLMYST